MLAVRKSRHIEYEAEAPQLPVSKAKSKKKQNPWSRYFFTVLVAVVIALSLTNRYTAIARSNFEIANIKTNIASLEKEHVALELNVASLKSPGRMQGIATSRLGMQLPDKVYYASSAPAAAAKQTVTEPVRQAAVPWGTAVAEASKR